MKLSNIVKTFINAVHLTFCKHKYQVVNKYFIKDFRYGNRIRIYQTKICDKCCKVKLYEIDEFCFVLKPDEYKQFIQELLNEGYIDNSDVICNV